MDEPGRGNECVNVSASGHGYKVSIKSVKCTCNESVTPERAWAHARVWTFHRMRKDDFGWIIRFEQVKEHAVRAVVLELRENDRGALRTH